MLSPLACCLMLAKSLSLSGPPHALASKGNELSPFLVSMEALGWLRLAAAAGREVASPRAKVIIGP